MSLRIPAIIPQRPLPARPLAENPARLLEVALRQVWETAMHDLPFVNPALGIEAVGFRRVQGDWLGVVVTPWAINLLLVPGGGDLWQDIPTGEHRQLAFPAGPIEFIGENSPDREVAIQAYQYCPMITQMHLIPDQVAAVEAAEAVLAAVFAPPPVPAAAAGAASAGESSGPQAAEAAVPPRRAFLRGKLARRT